MVVETFIVVLLSSRCCRSTTKTMGRGCGSGAGARYPKSPRLGPSRPRAWKSRPSHPTMLASLGGDAVRVVRRHVVRRVTGVTKSRVGCSDRLSRGRDPAGELGAG